MSLSVEPNHLAVLLLDSNMHSTAQLMAERLGLPVLQEDDALPDLTLTCADGRVWLRGASAPAGISVDLVGGKSAYRRNQSRYRDPLARAIGLKAGQPPLSIVDATAGLGRDATMMAAWGCHVRMVERSPVVVELLQDGLQRAQADLEVGAWVAERLELVSANAVAWMQALSLEARPDVVYLDPMYPERKKSAQVKKEMRLLQQLLGQDDDVQALFDVALKVARKRVVVKRPARGEPLSGPKPSHTSDGKSTRFDIYLTA